MNSKMAEEYEFVEVPPEELTCSICMKVLCQPHLVNCCEQQFCKECLDKWCRNNRTCPHCRSTDFSSILMKQKCRKIGQLKVYCSNKQHGCKAEIKICEFQSHFSLPVAKGGCWYVEACCPYRCKSKVFRGDLARHKELDCPKRWVNCVHCTCRGEYQYVVGYHTNKCLSFPLPCPLECGAIVPRKDHNAHRSTCPKEPVLCTFSSFGCKAKLCRGDLESHVKMGVVQHMTMLMKSHAALQADHKALQEEHAALKKTKKEQRAALRDELTRLGVASDEKYTTVQKEIVEQKSQFEELGLQLATDRKTVAKVQAQHATEWKALKTEIATLKRQLATQEKAAFAALRTQHITALRTEVATLQTHITEQKSLKEEVATLKAKVATLQTQHIAALKAEVKAEVKLLKTQQANALSTEIALLKKHNTEEQETLKIEIATLKRQASASKTEVAALKATLQAEHAKLRGEHLALKSAYSSKLQAAGALLQNAPETAQVYAILVDISHLTFGGSLTLSLSTTNRKSGHHSIVLSQEPPKPKYKFKLEWKTREPPIEEQGFAAKLFGVQPQQSYEFELSFLTVLPAPTIGAKFDATVRLDATQSMVRICCFESTPLMAKATLKCSKPPELLQLRLEQHNHEQCRCPCHHYCKSCQYQCDDASPRHTCGHCGNLCHRHHCLECGRLCDRTHCHNCAYCGNYCQKEKGVIFN